MNKYYITLENKDTQGFKEIVISAENFSQVYEVLNDFYFRYNVDQVKCFRSELDFIIIDNKVHRMEKKHV